MAGESTTVGKLFVELLVKDEKFGPALKRAADGVSGLANEVQKTATSAAQKVEPLVTAIDKVAEAEKRHVAAILASSAAEKARAAALGITIPQLKQMDNAIRQTTASEQAAAAAAKAATDATAGLGDAAAQGGTKFDALGKAMGPLGGVISRISPVAGAAASSIAGLTSGVEAAAGAIGTTAGVLGSVLALLAAALTPVIGQIVVMKRESDEAAARLKFLADHARDLDSALRGLEDAQNAQAAATYGFTESQKKLIAIETDRDRKILDFQKTQDVERKAAEDAIRLNEKRQTQMKNMGSVLGTAVSYYTSYASSAGEARLQLKELTRIEQDHTEVLYEEATALSETVRLVDEKAAADKAAADKAAKEKARAEAGARAAAAATQSYASAIQQLSKVTDDANRRVQLSVFESLGADAAERTLLKATESARQDAEQSIAAAERALAEALAAATVIGGKAGAKMADGAKATFVGTQGAILGDMLRAEEAATKVATGAQQAAADKRVAITAGSIALQVTSQEEYAATIAKIQESYSQRFAELQQVDVVYSRLSADERLVVEQKLQDEMAALRDAEADAEVARAKVVAKKIEAVAKGVFTEAKQTVDDLYGYQTDRIADTQTLLEADTAAREKLAQGEALSEKERSAVLTAMEKAALEQRLAAQKEAALVTYRVQQGLAVVSIAMSTAAAIMRAIADLGPVAGGVAAVIIAAIGVVQAGLVLGTPPPEFHVGGVVGEDDRRRSPGRSTGSSVAAELEVGEGVLVSRAVQALGGAAGVARLNVDPIAAMGSMASRMTPVGSLGRTSAPRFDPRSFAAAPSPPPFTARGSPREAGGPASSSRPIVVVSKIGERTFDTVMADGIDGRRLPKVRSRLQRMTGITVGLEG